MANIKSINGNPIVVDADGIADGTVTDAKLAQTGGILETFADFADNVAELVEPSNVYNKDDVTSGILNIYDQPSSNSSYVYTNYYIPVSAGDVVNSNRMMRVITAYDADKRPKSSSGVTSNTTTYTVPDGISYIRVTMYAVYTDNAICINQPAAYTPWVEPYYRVKLDSGSVGTMAVADKAVEPVKTSFLERVNRHDSSTDSVGCFVNPTNGMVLDNASYVATDYIEVAEGEKLYVFSSADNSMYLRFVTAYDSNKLVIPSAGANNTTRTSSYTVPAGVSYVRMTVLALSGGNDFCISTRGSYTPYGTFEPTAEIEIDTLPEPLVVMPAEVCVAVGRTVEIYNSQVCINAEHYHFRWSCAVGYQYKRKFQIVGTADNVGSYTATLTLYDDGLNAVYTGTTTIKVVADNITTLKICPIGDSLTNRKAWLPRVMELNSGIEWVGTRWSASTTAASTYRHEGRSGATVNTYLTDSRYAFDTWGETPNNPFWNPSAQEFDWNYYKNTYNIDADAVQIFLGTNGLSLDNSGQVENIMSMVSAIRAADANIPVYVVNTLYWGNQNAIAAIQKSGATDGQTGSFRGYMAFEQNMMVYDLATKLIDAVEELDDANVHLVPIAFTHDSEYNFGAVETPVNPYATQTELLPSEAVHPQAQGYYQMADIIYSTLCAYER